MKIDGICSNITGLWQKNDGIEEVFTKAVDNSLFGEKELKSFKASFQKFNKRSHLHA